MINHLTMKMRKISIILLSFILIGNSLFGQNTFCHGNFADGFEDQSLGIWTNAQSGVSLVSTTHAFEGDHALKFTNAVNWPILTSIPLDMMAYDFIRFDCYIWAENMESGDGILLEVSRDNGVTFELVQRWIFGPDFQNNSFSLLHHQNQISNLGGGPIQLRLTLEGANDNDVIYADNFAIRGCNFQQQCALAITDIISTPPEICDGNWSIDIITNLPSGNLNYSIDGGGNWQNSSEFDNIIPGEAHQIIVKNLDNDCMAGWPEDLIQPNIGGAWIDNLQHANASNCNQGSIVINAVAPSGESGIMEYQIKNLSSQQIISWQTSNVFLNLAPATYQAYVRWVPSVGSIPACITTGAGQEYQVEIILDPNGCGNCTDGIKNGDELGVDCGGSQCPACDGSPGNGCTYFVLDQNDFESGWGIWNDGGSDARRDDNPNVANSATHSLLIRDNSSRSIITTDVMDWSAYEKLKISFSYITTSFDNSSEDFWLQISLDGGNSFVTIQDWDYSIDFWNDQRQDVEVIYEGTLSTEVALRFRCDASSDGDQVNLDDIVIEGCLAPACDDGIQNGDELGVDCGGSECPACPEPVFDLCTYEKLDSNGFQAGWGIWNDGGTHATRIQDISGNYSLQIKNNSSSSVITTDPFDWSSYDRLRIQFSFKTSGMNSLNHDFFLEISLDDGASYSTVGRWVYNNDFLNGERKYEDLTYEGTLSTSVKLRFRCDASDDSDKVTIDDVIIEGCVFPNCVELLQNGTGNPVNSPNPFIQQNNCLSNVRRYIARSIYMYDLARLNHNATCWGHPDDPDPKADGTNCVAPYDLCQSIYCTDKYCQNIQMLVDINASMILRTADFTRREHEIAAQGEPGSYFEAVENLILHINNAYDAADLRRPIVQAVILEHVDGNNIENVTIPEWVIDDFKSSDKYANNPDFVNEYLDANGVALSQNYEFSKIVFTADGFPEGIPDNLRSAPDLTRIEAQMWIYHQAKTFIDLGYRAIWMGQIGLIGYRDRESSTPWKETSELFDMIRSHAQSIDGFVLLQGENPRGLHDLNYNGDLLFDYDGRPSRPREIVAGQIAGENNCGDPYDGNMFAGSDCASAANLAFIDECVINSFGT